MTIQEKLCQHYRVACNHFGEDVVLGVFLYGSQNYGTNTEVSDVDTKCILIPDLYHLACKPYKTKHLKVGFDGGVCECMTIQHMVANWKKQNINFVEILFTPYYIINPKFVLIWDKFVCDNREDIAHYDVKKAILSMAHQALHTLQQDPSNKKKQMNFLRIHKSLCRLLHPSKGYWDVIHFDNREAEELCLVRELGASPQQIGDAGNGLKYYIENADTLAKKVALLPEQVIILDRILDRFIMSLIEINLK